MTVHCDQELWYRQIRATQSLSFGFNCGAVELVTGTIKDFSVFRTRENNNNINEVVMFEVLELSS